MCLWLCRCHLPFPLHWSIFTQRSHDGFSAIEPPPWTLFQFFRCRAHHDDPWQLERTILWNCARALNKLSDYQEKVNGILYFLANDGTHGVEIWRTDGTEVGTFLVKDIYPGGRLSSPPGSVGTYPSALAALNGMLYFIGNDSLHGQELWRSDGTSAGTVRVSSVKLGNVEMVAVNGALYFGFGRMLYRIGPLLTGSADGEELSPSVVTLHQNYPNPFNPSTTIRYGLPERSHVSLAVYNTLAQQVSVLQNGEQEAGYHEVKFDAANLPSGVYFYRLQAGSFAESKKLLLVRWILNT